MNRILFNSALITFLAGVSGMVPAAPLYSADDGFGIHQCGTGDETSDIKVSDVTLNGDNATTCFGAYEGNNGDTLIWGDHTWTSIAKLEEENGFSTGSFSLDFEPYPETQSPKGTWKYTDEENFSNWESFFVVTKASKDPGWAAYFFDDMPNANSLSGTFSIPWSANNKDSINPADLSHLSLYARTAVTVPEPSIVGLLGLGLVGFGLRRRRQRTN